MEFKSYPKEKRDFISERPKEEIMAFCKEIDYYAWKKITLKLPPANGFRKGSGAEIKERFRSYIWRIGHWTDGNWELFSELWLAWIKSHPVLDNLLVQYHNDQDFQGGTPISPNSQLDIGCFKFLSSFNEESEISKELLKRFYDYGYFLEDTKIEYYISFAKSELELKMLKSLHQIDVLNTKIAALEKINTESQQRFEQELKARNNQFDRLNVKIIELQNIISDFQRSFVQELKNNDVKIDLNIAALENQIKNLHDYCSELTDSLTNDLNEKLEEMAALLKSEAEALIELRSGYSNQEVGLTAGRTATSIFFERIFGLDIFLEYDSIEKMDKTFIQNFKSIGMTSRGAKQLSKELIVTILSQGTISFQGSFASILAHICARTISATNTSICYIPVGLLDGNNFRKIFDSFLAEASTSEMISTLIIEGVNLSAFETFAPRLNKYIEDQAIGINPLKTIIICTLVNGPASLECPLMLCDSGPIFDTDCLEWRKKWETNDIQEGAISIHKYNEWSECPVDIPENWDELYEEFNCLGGFTTVLRERFLQKAAMHIEKMKASSSMIQSLAFGWLIPRGILLNVDFSIYKELIAGGKLDAEQPDERINKLLALNVLGD